MIKNTIETTTSIQAEVQMETDSFTPTGFGDTIFRQRYARTSDETWMDACTRVASHICQAEENGNRAKWMPRFLEKLSEALFIPGGRIWYGSGRAKGQLMNCFVVPTEDSREGWGQYAHH